MTRRVTRLAALIAFPIALIHEFCHWIAAVGRAEDSVIVIDPAGSKATTYIDFRESTPRWAVALACVFPTVSGLAAGTIVVVWWAFEGFATPADLEGWMRLTIGSISWGVFSWPSPGDIDGARNGPPDGGSADATPGVDP